MVFVRFGFATISLRFHKSPVFEYPNAAHRAETTSAALAAFRRQYIPLQFKMKAASPLNWLLRKAAERALEGLWDEVAEALRAFAAGECANFFAAGYGLV